MPILMSYLKFFVIPFGPGGGGKWIGPSYPHARRKMGPLWVFTPLARSMPTRKDHA